MRDDLGRWNVQRAKPILKSREEAMFDLRRSGYTLADATVVAENGAILIIQHQWELQRVIQLSVRRLTKPRLTVELETVMKIQDDISRVEDDNEAAEEVLSRCAPSAVARRTRGQLRELRERHVTLKTAADELYDSPSVDHELPQYKDFSRQFVRLLIMDYDAKCIVRHKLIGRFFQWDRLNRAVGGVHTQLSIKDYQRGLGNLYRTRKSTVIALNNYNTLCASLEQIAPAGHNVLLPQPLDDLSKLRDSPRLLEDVWIGGSPRHDRSLINRRQCPHCYCAMHQLDRCGEEE
ncbi:hypothetical protein BKA62DRAFT_671762 [Auriculariales sp. MPI-PUGE-AT-0066]|nr:hypothetical protein BKA62DRAFT_671762 [Auriculariales sp. MPI-PUGE-AT-0066]